MTGRGERGRDGLVIVVVTVTMTGGDVVGGIRLRRKASEGDKGGRRGGEIGSVRGRW